MKHIFVAGGNKTHVMHIVGSTLFSVTLCQVQFNYLINGWSTALTLEGRVWSVWQKIDQHLCEITCVQQYLD